MNKHALVDRVAETAHRCYNTSINKNYPMDLLAAGGYLHLEVSEFIEALRNKRGIGAHEAADVLFQLLTMLHARNVNINEMLLKLEELADGK
jgi:phosphoribosyl-ATP pyrophosphohydrolase